MWEAVLRSLYGESVGRGGTGERPGQRLAVRGAGGERGQDGQQWQWRGAHGVPELLRSQQHLMVGWTQG